MLFNGILSKAATGALAKTGSNLTAEAGLPRLIAFYRRNFFAARRLPRLSGFLSFVSWPVGNDRTDDLVQKV
jgi:hypothetical protein